MAEPAIVDRDIVIAPPDRWPGLQVREIWRYRELLYFLAWRDIKVRYKQTALGFGWVILQPLFLMLVFSFVFGRLARVPTDGIPYPVFVLSGLVPWQLFSYALTDSSNSLITNEQLLTKVYFPRLIIPISSVIVGLADFCVSFLLLLVVAAFNGVKPGWSILFIPFFAAFATLTALAAGLWLSALNVRFRDVRHTLTFLTQVWLLATPVAYPASVVPEPWRLLYALNPMTGVVEGFRWALLGHSTFDGSVLTVSVLVVCLLFAGAVYHFRSMEDYFADLA
jgi:lipopolysaccharide transport system permease protein